MLESVAIALVATLVLVPCAVASFAWTVTLGMKRLGVTDADLRDAMDRVLLDPKATAQLAGLAMVGLCILLGQVFS